MKLAGRPHSQPDRVLPTGKTRPLVSLVVLTWNRVEELRATLKRLIINTDKLNQEIIVVDNGSRDGTSDLIRRDFPDVKLIHLSYNLGTEGRNLALMEAQGQYLVMLDDDSVPTPGSLKRMVQELNSDHILGAVAFRVRLPDGRDEAGGSFNVFVGCGVGFRTQLLRDIGGYPTGYRYYVEEYDVSYRLMRAGYHVRYFNDIVVEHRQSPRHRDFNRILCHLVRNNLWLWPRFFSIRPAAAECYRIIRRYWWIARREQVVSGFLWGLAQGLLRLPLALARRQIMPKGLAASLLGIREIGPRLENLVCQRGFSKIGFVLFTKDFERFLTAAHTVGLQVPVIYDDLLSRYRQIFRGLAVRPLDRLDRREFSGIEALVVASTSPGAGYNLDKRLKDLGISLEVIQLFPYT
ncbi:MAG: glycosyltransferase [Deltaproteobacteria bacterium]|nr:glycosyltransferase [Deltaproteobacteria bacterium]